MRVFHIMAGKGNGGAEVYAADMMIALQEQGVTQEAVLHPAQARLDSVRRAGVAVRAGVLRWPVRLCQRWAAARAIARFQPDIVHCWMRRAAALAPRLDAPVIGWFGGYYAVRHFARCSHFIGVTPDIAAHQQREGVAADKSFFVPTFPMAERSGAPVERAALGVPDGATVLLTLSRLHPKKGLDVLLQALQHLPDCVLWMPGDGPSRGELEALAERLGVMARVKFLGWREDRGALLQAADICVLPSRYEPFGTVMLEAWASNRPLVAAAAAGPAAFVRDGDNGMLVPVDDAAALLQAIRQVKEDKALRARIVAGGWADYQARFTRRAAVRQMMDVYRQIMADGR